MTHVLAVVVKNTKSAVVSSSKQKKQVFVSALFLASNKCLTDTC